MSTVYPVALFAYNEGKKLKRCVESLKDSTIWPQLRVFILANGCTDNTETVAEDIAVSEENVKLVSIAVGDKANAWNHFVHEVASIDAEAAFFIDGDVQACDSALTCLLQTLEDNPSSVLAAALPKNGRNIKQLSEKLITRKTIIGCLYAMRYDFIQQLRHMDIRIPCGAIHEDGLLSRMAKYIRDEDAVAVSLEAGFIFDSISLYSFSDWRKYLRRRIIYSQAHFQNRCMKKLVKAHGYASLPLHMDDVCSAAADQITLGGVRFRGADVMFDTFAWFYMRKKYHRS